MRAGRATPDILDLLRQAVSPFLYNLDSNLVRACERVSISTARIWSRTGERLTLVLPQKALMGRFFSKFTRFQVRSEPMTFLHLFDDVRS